MSHADDVQRLKENLYQALRVIDELAAEQPGEHWPYEAATIARSLSAALQDAMSQARLLYSAIPTRWEVENNVIRPRRWSSGE
jgi:hypothetical protein